VHPVEHLLGGRVAAERVQGAVDRQALRRHAQAVGAKGGADLVVAGHIRVP
jgi:hypothetical protein